MSGTAADARHRALAALEDHRTRAANFAMSILVWGPNQDSDGTDARLRVAVRDELNRVGHFAVFSEELNSASAVPDPIMDEVLQAEAFDLIVVIYGSRGTQTERDTILINDKLATKSLLVVHNDTFQRINSSVSGYSWNATKAAIIQYQANQQVEDACKLVVDWVDRARRHRYVRTLLTEPLR